MQMHTLTTKNDAPRSIILQIINKSWECDQRVYNNVPQTLS